MPVKTPHHAAGDLVQSWVSAVGSPPNDASLDWGQGIVIERYRAAAAHCDVQAAVAGGAVRDGLTLLNRIRDEHSTLLDVGCGFGLWRRILENAPAPLTSWRYTGVEISDALVTLCRQIDPGGSYRVATGERLPFDDAAFDVVLCSGVLAYTNDWRRCLAECARVSRRYVVLLRTPVVRYRPTCRAWQRTESGTGLEYHRLQLFGRVEFRGALQQAGLSTIDEDYADDAHPVEGLDERLFYLNHLLTKG